MHRQVTGRPRLLRPPPRVNVTRTTGQVSDLAQVRYVRTRPVDAPLRSSTTLRRTALSTSASALRPRRRPRRRGGATGPTRARQPNRAPAGPDPRRRQRHRCGHDGLSLAARRRGAHTTGVLFGLAGAGAMGAGGWLGGDLVFARGVGVNQAVFDSEPGGFVLMSRLGGMVTKRRLPSLARARCAHVLARVRQGGVGIGHQRRRRHAITPGRERRFQRSRSRLIPRLAPSPARARSTNRSRLDCGPALVGAFTLHGVLPGRLGLVACSRRRRQATSRRSFSSRAALARGATDRRGDRRCARPAARGRGSGLAGRAGDRRGGPPVHGVLAGELAAASARLQLGA